MTEENPSASTVCKMCIKIILSLPVVRELKRRNSIFLESRSALRSNHPSDAKWHIALLYVAISIPIAILMWVLLAISRLRGSRWNVLVLQIPGEFAQFVQHMEALRVSPESPRKREVILALSRHRQVTLGELYEFNLKTPVIWGGGLSGLIQQAWLLQPRFLVTIDRNDSRLTRHPYEFPRNPLRLDTKITELRMRTLSQLRYSSNEFVALATFSLEYDMERNPESADKQRVLETVGHELSSSIDFLQKHGLGVVLLGSPENQRSRIPRHFPRLSEFGRLGGAHEVALASCCKYFWTDNTGAWWLGAPFKRPILITNIATQHPRRGKMPENHLVVPVRFRDKEGHELTFREIYSRSNSYHYKAAARGELDLIRNSPEEIVDAHHEMIARLNGDSTETNRNRELLIRFREITNDFPRIHPMQISVRWLSRHSYLLD